MSAWGCPSMCSTTSVALERELDHLRTVEDLVGEPVGRLVDVHRAGEPEVRRELHVVPGREVELRDALARADLHGREEAAEVVLDARQVHLVQDHVETARRAVLAVRGVPFARGLLHELAERCAVVEAVERREVPQQVLVRGPARVDGDELGARLDGIRRRPGRARSCRCRSARTGSRTRAWTIDRW